MRSLRLGFLIEVELKGAATGGKAIKKAKELGLGFITLMNYKTLKAACKKIVKDGKNLKRNGWRIRDRIKDINELLGKTESISKADYERVMKEI